MLPRAIMNMLKQVKKKNRNLQQRTRASQQRKGGYEKETDGNFRTEQYNHRNIELSGSLTVEWRGQEKNSELEYSVIETTPYEPRGENRLDNKQRLRTYGTVTKYLIFGSSETGREEKHSGVESVLKETMAENFPNLPKHINIHIHSRS